MTSLDGYFLPSSIQVPSFTTLTFGSAAVRMPVPTAAIVTETVDHLLLSQGRNLSKQSTETLLNLIDAAVSRWLKPDEPLRKTAEAVLPSVTGLSQPMIHLGLTRLLEGYRKEPLRRVLNHALGDIRCLDEFQPVEGEPGRLLKAVGPRLTAHVLAGNIPGLGIPELIITLLLKSAFLCKVSSEEPVCTALFAKTLAEIEPRIADSIAVLGWKGGSQKVTEIEKIAFGRSELVTATGTDEAVLAVQRTIINLGKASTRFIGYGHRFSLGIIGSDAIDTKENLKNIARRAALDVAMYDQQGCLSPHLFYVETGGTHSPEDFARSLGDALADLHKHFPRGSVEPPVSSRLHQIRSVARMKQAQGRGTVVYASPSGTDWTVIYEADPTVVLSPLYRTVRVKPVHDLSEIVALLELWRPYLQAVGVAAAKKRLRPLAVQLARVGVNRICPIGSMQSPPVGWSQDGRRFIADRVRWVDLEMP